MKNPTGKGKYIVKSVDQPLNLVQRQKHCKINYNYNKQLMAKHENVKYDIKNMKQGTSLVVQWLRLCISTAEGAGSIPGRGTKIPHAAWHSKKKRKKNPQKTSKQKEENKD